VTRVAYRTRSVAASFRRPLRPPAFRRLLEHGASLPEACRQVLEVFDAGHEAIGILRRGSQDV
jgi:hypothetical protein